MAISDRRSHTIDRSRALLRPDAGGLPQRPLKFSKDPHFVDRLRDVVGLSFPRLFVQRLFGSGRLARS